MCYGSFWGANVIKYTSSMLIKYKVDLICRLMLAYIDELKRLQ